MDKKQEKIIFRLTARIENCQEESMRIKALSAFKTRILNQRISFKTGEAVESIEILEISGGEDYGDSGTGDKRSD